MRETETAQKTFSEAPDGLGAREHQERLSLWITSVTLVRGCGVLIVSGASHPLDLGRSGPVDPVYSNPVVFSLNIEVEAFLFSHL